ncbi:MAG: ABC transporter ATP-binding protein [Ferruginibacter sp.]
MDEPLLTVKNLSVRFKTGKETSTAVNNVSFDVMPGELVAIVGESGSGKSVSSLSMMQLLPKQAAVTGEVIFSPNGDSIDLLFLPLKEMMNRRGKDIAMIFQEPMTSLNPVFTCGDQVMEAIQLHQQVSKKVAAEKVIALFEKVKLPDPSSILHRYPHQLSGGQKQRVMIAMAMSCNPSLLIADEPTTALDVTVQKTILELIKELQQQNRMSVILITHDLGIVADIADKVIVMYKGSIVEQGKTAEVLKHPQHAYTKALLACRPALHQKGQRLPVVGEEIENKKDEIRNEKAEEQQQGKTTTGDNDRKSTVLSVENLKVYYPGKKSLFGKPAAIFKAVDDVSFTVNKGETLGLVGESGCGKTTLGRAILQLIPTTAGRILLNGVDIAHLTKKQLQPLRKDLQVVFQDPYGSLNPRITIGDAILEPMKVHSVLTGRHTRKEKVIELLEKVNLRADHFSRYPHQFSGGQRQRVCIARALALNPSFLIFDESVSALDVSVQAQVLNLLNDLKAAFNFTSIFISHDLSVVRYISDRIMVMQKGRIIEEGTSEEIYHAPKNEYTRTLIDAIPGKSLSI